MQLFLEASPLCDIFCGIPFVQIQYYIACFCNHSVHRIKRNWELGSQTRILEANKAWKDASKPQGEKERKVTGITLTDEKTVVLIGN